MIKVISQNAEIFLFLTQNSSIRSLMEGIMEGIERIVVSDSQCGATGAEQGGCC